MAEVMSEIQKKRRELKLTQDQLSEMSGVSKSLIAQMETGKKNVTRKTAERLAAVLQCKAIELWIGDDLQEITHSPGKLTVRVIGAVQAGAWREALEWPDDDQFDVTIYDERYADVFGLQVVGDSMNGVYVENTVIVCRKFDEVNEFPPISKRVIVQRRNATGQIEATVKELELIDGQPWLMPKSSNPIYEGVEFKNNGDGDGDTNIIGVVVGSYLRE